MQQLSLFSLRKEGEKQNEKAFLSFGKKAAAIPLFAVYKAKYLFERLFQRSKVIPGLVFPVSFENC